jgi:putative spermidine/putrescine transport system substrate-binding protein
MTKTTRKTKAQRGATRRTVLKGGAAAAGLAAGSGAITGFPTIWAQNIKDITLNHTGQSYSTLIDIARQASEDLGFTVEMSVTDHPGMTNRMVNDPTSIDIADTEIWQTKVFVPLGKTQAVDVNLITEWDKMTPLYTKGTFGGAEVSRQGDSPYEIMYRESKDATRFHDGETEWATFMPGVYNADTLGIRPDLVGREITSWADLLDPAFAGKSAIQNIPAIGIMDAIMALEAAGEVSYVDKGNLTRDEIDQTIGKLIELKQAGHWRALWNTFDESVNLMAAGEVVIQSMWSPAVTAVKAQGVPCVYQPLKEGGRRVAG